MKPAVIAKHAAVRDSFRRPVTIWIGSVCLLVIAMVVVGGITRLTGSGLSIVEWRPVTGALPPLSDAGWQEAFEAYRSSPQYRLVNIGMTLAEFKRIFAWEYGHRLLGRLLGVVFLVPWAYFVARGALSRRFSAKLLIGFALGAFQGLVGWLMVASGLVHEPRVSHYRLAAHLTLAFVLLGYLFWTWLDLRETGEPTARRVRLPLRLFLFPLGAQIVYGAFTAGLHAGVGYNTFPTMHGAWVPRGALALTPAWRNAVENPATVQFVHRALGALVAAAAIAIVVVARRSTRTVRSAVTLLGAVVMLQFALGVMTLLLVVPVSLGVLHQLGACALFLAALQANHRAAAQVSVRPS